LKIFEFIFRGGLINLNYLGFGEKMQAIFERYSELGVEELELS